MARAINPEVRTERSRDISLDFVPSKTDPVTLELAAYSLGTKELAPQMLVLSHVVSPDEYEGLKTLWDLEHYVRSTVPRSIEGEKEPRMLLPMHYQLAAMSLRDATQRSTFVYAASDRAAGIRGVPTNPDKPYERSITGLEPVEVTETWVMSGIRRVLGHDTDKRVNDEQTMAVILPGAAVVTDKAQAAVEVGRNIYFPLLSPAEQASGRAVREHIVAREANLHSDSAIPTFPKTL